MKSDGRWTIHGKRLILTVTTGRSGTGYLCHLLQGLPNLCCLHEPHPKFSDVMRTVQTAPDVAEAFLIEHKLPFIRNAPEATYIETSHLACKGFIEPLVEHGLCPDLIVLRRDKIQVATSLFLLGTVPARTPLGMKFLLSPSDPKVLPIKNWEDLHDWALCYWYTLEIERRAEELKTLIERNGRRTLATTIQDIKQTSGLHELMAFVRNGSTAGPALEDDICRGRLDTVINSKKENKDPNLHKMPNGDSIAEMVREVELRVLKAEKCHT